MTHQVQKSQDWFISAIIKDGTVGHCLSEVIRDLQFKQDFVKALMAKISEHQTGGIDAITEISSRIQILESTVSFRMSILSPDRRGAWFRRSATTSSGPFSGHLLADPVFSQFDEGDVAKVREGLVACWRNRGLLQYPLRATESCLWKSLLVLNFDLWTLGDLGHWPRLECMPEALDSDLDSRSLKAFLTNVKAEYVGARERLDRVYESLLAASDRFFAKCVETGGSRRSSARSSFGSESINDGYAAAENVREEFRKRRASPTIRRPVGKSAQDLEALRFMGFDDFPTEEDLKQRYHRMALDMHPDRQGGNESRFKLLAKSYNHLRRVCVQYGQ
jgi:hypothetical protein